MSYYLDMASTTQVKSEVIDAMMPYLTDKWQNPSSLYSDSTYVKIAIDNARKTIADFIGAKPNEIYFTSGGSESNCWAIQGFVNSRLAKQKLPYVITTSIEHKSIIECVENQNMTVVHYLSVDENGFVDIDELNDVIGFLLGEGADANDILVSIQYANNEIGTIQDIMNIADTVHMYGCMFHTDAVQAFAHEKIDVDLSGIDMMSASAHKIGACKGTGFLYIRDSIEIKPLIYGSQMDGMRGGTENVAGIVGMAKAVELARDSISDNASVAMNRDYFINKLIAIGCTLNGHSESRLANNINVMLPYDINGETLLYSLDVDDIQIGTGSACNSRSIESSHVLRAIGLSDKEAQSCVRITIPDDITMDDIDEVVESIDKSIKVLKSINEMSNEE